MPSRWRSGHPVAGDAPPEGLGGPDGAAGTAPGSVGRMGSASAEAASADGRWAGGVYTKWTSTTYTLLLLRSMGLAARHPQALQACEVLRDSGFWTDGGINFYPHRTNRSETRISSMVLALVCWFQLEDTQVDRLAGTCLAGSWRMAVELPFQRGRPRLSRLVSYHHLGAGGIVGV